MKRLYIHAKEFQLHADDEKTRESLRTLGGCKNVIKRCLYLQCGEQIRWKQN